MTLENALQLIRARVNDEYDTGYSDDVLIDYINNAIHYLAAALIAKNNPLLIKEMTVSATGSNEVPANFAKFVGGYPLKRVGSSFYIVDGSRLLTVRYYYYPEDLSSNSAKLPFDNDVYNHIIINLACIYALNQHEYNVEQDKALRSEVEQMVDASLGAE